MLPNACPKPEPRPKSKPRRIPTKNRAPISRKPIKAKKRTKAEYERIYHSEARVQFVKRLPCVGCGRVLIPKLMDNAHIEPGGVGRKADYDKIVPLCNKFAPTYSCHGYFHSTGRAFVEKLYGINLEELAEETQRAWLQFSCGESQSAGSRRGAE